MLKNLTDDRRRCRPGRSKRGGAQDGASLIEIMVVLVILLIGVFLAIRIFPAGLATLATTENRGRATHLSQATLGDTVSNAANLPSGVLSATVVNNSGTYTLQYNTAIDPDDLTASTIFGNDLNKFTYIKGEPVKIPVPITGSDGNPVSPYLVKFGPMQMDDTVGVNENAPAAGSVQDASHYGAYLNVTSGPLGVTNYSSAGGTNAATAINYVQGALNCLVDYGSGTTAYIMFAPGSSEGYTLTYSFYTSGTAGAVSTITNQTIAVMGTGGVWQAIALPSGSNGIVPGSLTVTRTLDRVSVNLPFSTTNPFQYKLASTLIPGTTVNPGLIYFNPAAAGLSVNTASGQQSFTAYVDYFVANWHILHDDIQVPTVTANTTTGLIPVKLSMDVLKRLGDANPDNTPYTSLYNPSDPSAENDIDVINLGTTQVITNSTQTPELIQGNLVHGVKELIGGTASDGSPSYYVDTDSQTGTYRTGTIYVDPAKLPQGSQIRVFYQADGDWGIALRKAFAQYTPELGTSATDPTTGITTITSSTGIQPRPMSYNTFGIDRSSGNRIYFGLSDLNKSVSISLQYVVNGAVVRVPPTQFTIDNEDVSKTYAYIDLTAPNTANSNALSTTDQSGIAGDPNWTVYGPIQGVSVKSRVIWHDNNNVTNNWRVQDLDTYLTATGS